MCQTPLSTRKSAILIPYEVQIQRLGILLFALFSQTSFFGWPVVGLEPLDNTSSPDLFENKTKRLYGRRTNKNTFWGVGSRPDPVRNLTDSRDRIIEERNTLSGKTNKTSSTTLRLLHKAPIQILKWPIYHVFSPKTILPSFKKPFRNTTKVLETVRGPGVLHGVVIW